jgi:hypothetical protein
MLEYSGTEMLTGRTFAWTITMARPMSDWWSKQSPLLP